MTDRSSAGEARRAAVSAAALLEFDESQRSNIGIAVTEAANNVLLHAGAGEFLVCPFEDGGCSWLDLLALDSGPGIRDIPRAFEDGHSTIGTAGQGLGAIQRLSSACSLYSVPQRGTALWMRFLKNPSHAVPEYGALNIPMKGETECGDSFLVLRGPARSLYMLTDGLGHGAQAAEAAAEAVTTVRSLAHEAPAEIVARTHDALKKTRGAAMSVAVVEHERKALLYCGVGNVSSAIVSPAGTRNLAAQNGTLGVRLPHVQEYTYPIEDSSSLLMFSDGLTTKCSLSGYLGLPSRPPMLIAGVLYRDFSRRRDDATVLYASLKGGAR